MNIIDTLYNILISVCGDIPVSEGWYIKDIGTHVTFLILSDSEEDFYEDINLSESYLVQVDVWSKNSNESMQLKQTIKSRMKEEFAYINGQDDYDRSAKIYHRAMRFSCDI